MAAAAPAVMAFEYATTASLSAESRDEINALLKKVLRALLADEGGSGESS